MLPKFEDRKIYFKDGRTSYIGWYHIVNPEAIMFRNYYGRDSFTYKNGTFYERVSIRDIYGDIQTDVFPAPNIDYIVIDGVTYRNAI